MSVELGTPAPPCSPSDDERTPGVVPVSPRGQHGRPPGTCTGATTPGRAPSFGAAARTGQASPMSMTLDHATPSDAGAEAIRPFVIDVPEPAIEDLRRRVAATRWPEVETVEDTTQGVRLATMQALATYWLDHHDWRRAEARINAVP